jgi:hypothetical protein
MARNDSWIRVEIRNRKTGRAIYLYHPPKEGAAGEDVDRELRAILEIPSPQPPGYQPVVTIKALPSPADWLTDKVPASEVSEEGE